MPRFSLLLCLALLAVACGSEAPQATVPTATGESSPSPTPTATATATPEAQATGADEPAEEAAGTTRVDAWYVRESPRRLFVEPVNVELDSPTVAVARAAMVATIEQQPDRPGLSTAAPQGTKVLDVALEGRVLTVDVSGEVTAGGGSAQETALREQLAHAGTQFDTVDRVRLLVEGQPVTELWGHLDWSQPFTADPFAVSPIVIRSPAWEAHVDGPAVTAGGSANVFEANVLLTLHDAQGGVVSDTFTTATCGTGCRGTWSHTFPGLSPGRYRLVAHEDDASGGEGGPPFSTELWFTVE